MRPVLLAALGLLPASGLAEAPSPADRAVALAEARLDGGGAGAYVALAAAFFPGLGPDSSDDDFRQVAAGDPLFQITAGEPIPGWQTPPAVSARTQESVPDASTSSTPSSATHRRCV